MAIRAGSVLVVMAVGLGACGGAQQGAQPVQGTQPNDPDTVPAWVERGCSALPGESVAICGRGSATNPRNPGLEMTVANQSARKELALELSARIDAMLKDCRAAAAGAEDLGLAGGDEEQVVELSHQISAAALPGTQVVESWSSRTGTRWVLVKLDVEAFKGALNGMKQLAANTRRCVLERTDRAFKGPEAATVPAAATVPEAAPPAP